MIGGWGYLLHERGSAYAVVRNIILSAIKHYEKGQPLTELELALLKEMGVSRLVEVKPIFYQQNHKEKIAGYTRFVKEMAHRGNLQAIEELKQDIVKESAIETDNVRKKVFENIKNLADIWADIDKKQKNMLLKSIIEKIVISNGNIEIRLKDF